MKMYLVLIALSFLFSSYSLAQSNSKTVMEFLRLKNDGNVELVLNLFAENPILQLEGLGTITGLKEVRDILEYDITLNTQLQFEECKATELEVTCRAIETNDWLKEADIEVVTYDENRFIFTSDGRIKSGILKLSAKSRQLLVDAMTQFDVWARRNYLSDYMVLFSDEGTFVYNSKNAQKVLILLHQWKASKVRSKASN